MSYDLNFWDQENFVEKDPREIYRELCEGKEVEGLLYISTDAFFKRILEEFPGASKESDGSLFWKGEENSFQATSGPQHIRIDCYGTPGEWMNVFIDIGNEFSCPLYDPQVDQRFAG